MEKKTIIKITVWIIAIVVFLCWFIVTGGELKYLDRLSEDYTVIITIDETHIEGYPEETVHTTAYELTGEDIQPLKEILQKHIKGRRLLNSGLTIREPESYKWITILANNDSDSAGPDDGFIIKVKYRDYVELYEPGIYIKNYDKDLEGLILEYLSGFEPTNDVIE